MVKKLSFAILACGVLLATACVIRDTSGQKSSAAELPRIKANQVVQLRQQLGKRVTVYGKVVTTAKSKSGHNFLNFHSSELSVICFKDDLAKFKSGQPADLYQNKEVEVQGTLQLHKGKLQIKLTDPAGIRLLTTTQRNGIDKVSSVELTQTGGDTWLSPAGLRYQGRDSQGLTRVEHILRHARDIPDRDGPHGVFDGDKGQIFALIDEAWQLAQKRKQRANVQRDRGSYTVSMGRRVGYLGGRAGKSRRNPPLRRVFIVFKIGTKNIITAFPK